jgi:hypothetical protein
MRATQKLHAIGQSLWLDNITRGLLTSGTLDPAISPTYGYECQKEPMKYRPSALSLSGHGTEARQPLFAAALHVYCVHSRIRQEPRHLPCGR